MRYPASQTAERHERSLDEASRLFRAEGIAVVARSPEGRFPAWANPCSTRLPAGQLYEMATKKPMIAINRTQNHLEVFSGFHSSPYST